MSFRSDYPVQDSLTSYMLNGVHDMRLVELLRQTDWKEVEETLLRDYYNSGARRIQQSEDSKDGTLPCPNLKV